MAPTANASVEVAVKPTVGVGPSTIAGGSVTLVAFLLAIVAFAQGARDEATISALAVGTITLVTTLAGRFAQATAAVKTATPTVELKAQPISGTLERAAGSNVEPAVPLEQFEIDALRRELADESPIALRAQEAAGIEAGTADAAVATSAPPAFVPEAEADLPLKPDDDLEDDVADELPPVLPGDPAADLGGDEGHGGDLHGMPAAATPSGLFFGPGTLGTDDGEGE